MRGKVFWQIGTDMSTNLAFVRWGGLIKNGLSWALKFYSRSRRIAARGGRVRDAISVTDCKACFSAWPKPKGGGFDFLVLMCEFTPWITIYKPKSAVMGCRLENHMFTNLAFVRWGGLIKNGPNWALKFYSSSRRIAARGGRVRDAISVTDCITEDLTTTDYEEELSCCNGGTTGSITQTFIFFMLCRAV